MTTAWPAPFYGHCYTEFDDNARGDLILMSASTDGGLLWSAAIPTQNNGIGLGGQPVVLPDGTVVVSILGFTGRNMSIVAFRSTDAGAGARRTTWFSAPRPTGFRGHR